MSNQNHKLTALESLIMDSLWSLSQASVRQVQGHLQPVKPLAYNTVLTMLRIMREKGFVTSKRKGRMDIYQPTVSRQQIARKSLHDILDNFFAGSAQSLVSQLLKMKHLSREEIRGMRRELDNKLKGTSGRKGARND